MTSRSFALTWDYRCPFARNAAEHVLTALDRGAPWEVTWVPFSLDQMHVAEGDPDVWQDEAKQPALLAVQAGLVVRDQMPDAFNRVHRALFAARHDQGRDLRDPEVLGEVLVEQGVDGDEVLAAIADGWPLERFRKEHEQAVGGHRVWGVPTFLAGGQAVFIRLMDRPGDDAELARRTIERVLELVTGWPELNEFKHTSIPR